MNQTRRYLSYLLRLWQEGGGSTIDGEQPLWRASLESPKSEQCKGFASLVDLFDFLAEETGSNASWSERTDENGFQPPALSQ
jgi:hypothetical protein